MPRILALAIGILLTVPATTEADGKGRGVLTADRPIAGQYIVVLRTTPAEVEDVDVERAAERISRKYNAAVDVRWRHALKGFVARMSAAQAEALQEPSSRPELKQQ